MFTKKRSLYRYGFSQVARLVYIFTFTNGYVICQQLQRYRCYKRLEAVDGSGNLDTVIGKFLQFVVAFVDDGYYPAFTSFDLLHIAYNLFV